MLTFGEWQTTRRLTKFGHTGEVFEVRNHDGRRGALKHYLPTCPGTKETFLRERDFLASDDASDIKPELLDCGTAADGNPFFVMEWVVTLSRSSFPLIRTTKEVAAACARLRDSGYYHCDLKPSNVGRLNGRIVLIDFGCIQRIPSALHGNVAAGTNRYEADEVASGRITELSEIYSLGRMTAKLADWTTRCRLAGAILDATEKDTDLRPQSFEQFAASLDESDADFFRSVRAAARLWRKRIVYTLLALSAVALGYGLIAATSCMDRWYGMRELEVREIQTQAEYATGIGCKDIGDPTNAIRLLERALDGYRKRSETGSHVER